MGPTILSERGWGIRQQRMVIIAVMTIHDDEPLTMMTMVVAMVVVMLLVAVTLMTLVTTLIVMIIMMAPQLQTTHLLLKTHIPEDPSFTPVRPHICRT